MLKSRDNILKLCRLLKNVDLTWCVESGQHRRLPQLYLTRVQQRGHWGSRRTG
jgi:hypothetical protein